MKLLVNIEQIVALSSYLHTKCKSTNRLDLYVCGALVFMHNMYVMHACLLAGVICVPCRIWSMFPVCLL
jgi:hypothetical protein